MHVGMAAVFQNPKKKRSDLEVYQNELRLAGLAERLGFQSIWGVEHHFTDYTMCPDVLQFLTYMAGRTERVQLGSMVVVLPWHDPMRVAEEVSMLDNISGGRLILGLGRGAGKVEFDGFRLAMDESRGRFVESAEMLIAGLEQGFCEYQGTYVKQPRADIRPAPFRSFRGRTYAAAVSPESAPIMARLGVGMLIIPQKPWSELAKELDAYRAVYRDVNGQEAPPPVTAGWTFCDPDPGRARELARRYIGGYFESVLEHYQFAGDHLAHTAGYEYYGKFADKLATYGTESVIDFFTDLQV
jgi:alkanesulfonate monooxygenase SsuD/methylene tetrahydromethanopterin reductase-like flavin-dependent oxidoreductase (luciferase family)